MFLTLASRASSAFSFGRLTTTGTAFLSRPNLSNYRTVASAHTTITEADDTIITPRDPNTLYNFGPASSRDTVLFTCERPGGEPESGKIPASAIEGWAEFMRKQGIDEVLVLLDDNELEAYEDPGLVETYKKCALTAHRNPKGEVGASTRAMAKVSNCQADGKKIVAHCTHGQGRAGRVAAAWLTRGWG